MSEAGGNPGAFINRASSRTCRGSSMPGYIRLHSLNIAGIKICAASKARANWGAPILRAYAPRAGLDPSPRPYATHHLFESDNRGRGI